MKYSTKLTLIRYARMFGLSAFIIGCIATMAFICNKWIEAFSLLVSFFALRYKFDKTYHCSSTGLCTFVSISIFWLAIPVEMRIEYSLFFGTIVAFIIGFICYLVQCYADNANLISDKDCQISALCKELKKYQAIDLYAMSEDDLRKYARSKGLSENIIDTLILKIVHGYRWIDIMNERNYSKTAIRYHKKQIIEKLSITL